MKKAIIIFIFLISGISAQSQEDKPWYRTQVGTGDGNCGPASVAMAINWSTNSKASVEQVRRYIGYSRKDGATDFLELASAMRYWKVPFDIEIIKSSQGLKTLVDRKDLIAIVLIDSGKISNDYEGKFNRNYSLETGHYIVLSSVQSSYFIVQDPMPDGHDRLYKIDEVWNSLKDYRVVLVRNYSIR